MLFAAMMLRGRRDEEPAPAAAARPIVTAAKDSVVKPTAEPEELTPVDMKHDAGPKKLEAKPSGKHPAPIVTATATASATAPPVKTGKPTLDPGDPWQ